VGSLVWGHVSTRLHGGADEWTGLAGSGSQVGLHPFSFFSALICSFPFRLLIRIVIILRI
jgi:hypothetical protein